ncbi:MAG: HmuY family protein [Myxococcota bacterium]
MKYRMIMALLAASLLVAGCGDGGEANNDNQGNNGTQADAGTDAAMDTMDTMEEEDVPTVGDVSDDEFNHRCGNAPVQDWPLNDAVSDGSVNATTADGVTTLEIDASAGGSSASADNPFVYVDLSTGEKVEVTDLEAYSNTEWDLAFKRVVIRTNSGDSGPGDIEVAKLTETAFADVDGVPGDPGSWEFDESYDEDCNPLTDPIGTLVTAFNHLNPLKNTQSWYEYPDISPSQGEVYLIEVPAESTTYKMAIDAWDGGVYTVRIAEL